MAQVVVLFSVVNTSKHAILLMPPTGSVRGQAQDGKRSLSTSVWSTAEQLTIMDFRLSRVVWN